MIESKGLRRFHETLTKAIMGLQKMKERKEKIIIFLFVFRIHRL